VRGAEPDDPRDGESGVSAVVAPGHGPGILAWVMAMLAIVVVIAYLAGVF
jgi:hypothetical protein